MFVEVFEELEVDLNDNLFVEVLEEWFDVEMDDEEVDDELVEE